MRRMAITIAAVATLTVAVAGMALAAVEYGTADSEIIRGTDGPDKLYGRAGDDGIVGLGGRDRLSGGEGYDELGGKEGADVLYGGGDTDALDGGKGADVLYGNGGKDYLSDGPSSEQSRDELHGGEGNDVFFARNRPASKDIIRCGPGVDTVKADAKDRVSPDCERVGRR